MTRFYALAVLMLLGSPAYAGDSFSFVIGGHHIHVERSRHCNSASCVSVSIPGIYEKRARRDRYDDEFRDAPPPAPVTASAAPAVAAPQVSQPQVSQPPVTPAPPVACAPAAAPPRPVAPQVVAAAPPQVLPPQVQPVTTAAVPQPAPSLAPAAVAPSPPPAIARPADVAPPPVAAPRISKVVHRVEEAPDSPLGDWQTEGHKGYVRIEPCGQALCGYVLDASTNAKGETVLIDMKSKTSSEWSGNIYSRNSGNTYYATMTLKGPDSLQVEACALGKFFCSGNAWTRIAKPERLVTYRHVSTEPRS
jgi:uncharacterized protein (DUF2147 family)